MRTSGVTVSIYERLREGILSGRYGVGERLPPSRQLAVELGVSRHTVTTVYGRLVAEGFLEGAVGSGTRVAAIGAGSAPGPAAAPALPRERPVIPADALDLRIGTPDPALFPLEEWRRCVGRALRAPTAGPLFAADSFGDPLGEPELRSAIASWIGPSRGLVVSPEQVVVTAGAQQGFDLLLRSLVRPGELVAVEDPGYPYFRELAQRRGARLVGVPVDEHGILPEAVPDGARLVHVTPSHQFPLGSVLSLPRRQSLLAWARRNEAWIVEDDYDSEFRAGARPLEPLARLDPSGRVVYVASFSKVLTPALRLGFLVAPPALVAGLAAERSLCDRHGDPVSQRALATFLSGGAMGRHLHRTRREYAARRRRVQDALTGSSLAALGHAHRSAAGLHVCVEVPSADLEGALVHGAAARGVVLDGIGGYSVHAGARPGIAIGLGGAGAERLGQAMERLEDLADQLAVARIRSQASV